MENTAVRQPPSWELAPESDGLSLPDPESFVADCVSQSEDTVSVYQKLMDTIARAADAISRLNEAQASEHIQCLSTIAKGLRRNTAENGAFRFFYFGQFQTHVDMLKQELERNDSQTQILSVASRKHFAPIMQLLYTNQLCRQQELSDKLGIDRSNLSREMRRLEDSGLVDSRTVGRSRYYLLTPRGRRYYNTYLVMKDQLEEQFYSPSQSECAAMKEAPVQLSFTEWHEPPRLSPDSRQKESVFADADAKPRTMRTVKIYAWRDD